MSAYFSNGFENVLWMRLIKKVLLAKIPHDIFSLRCLQNCKGIFEELICCRGLYKKQDKQRVKIQLLINFLAWMA